MTPVQNKNAASHEDAENGKKLNTLLVQSNTLPDESQEVLIDKNNVYCVNNMTLAEAAEFYAAKGLKVLALAEKDKRPDGRVCPNGFKDATNDLTKVKSAWKQLPNLNIGIVTGKENGIVVVDIDGDVGKETWRNLIRQHEYKSKTLKIATGKGCHLYFKYPSALSVIKNRVRFVEGIDVRADGGYIVAAPSVHPSGRKYQVSRPINFSELEELPDWLLKLILGNNSALEMEPTGVNSAGQKLPMDVENALAVLSATKEGSRHDTLIKQANLIAGKCQQKGLDEATVKELILQAALKTGLPEDEAKGTIAASFKNVAISSKFSTFAGSKYVVVENLDELGAWEKPIMEETPKIGSVTKDMLPEQLNDILVALSEYLEVDLGLTLLIALSVISTCIQGKVIVEPSNDWWVNTNLYLIGIAESGSRKSEIVKFLTAPLREWEKVKKQTKVEEKKVQLFVSDSTMEALAECLSQNNERISIIVDEGGIFEPLTGLYSQGKANIDLLLKAWDGSYVNQSRVMRGSISLEHPLITFGVLCQPIVVKNLFSKNVLLSRGFIERFLYYYPESNLGKRKIRTTPVKSEYKAAYASLCEKLLGIQDTEEVIKLHFSAEAKERLIKFQISCDRQIQKFPDNAGIRSYLSKLHEKAARIATLYHMVDCDIKQEVSEECLNKAITLTVLLYKHYRKLQMVNGLSGEEQLTNDICAWIINLKQECFEKVSLTKRFKDRKIDNKRVNAKQLEKMLYPLIDNHIISRPYKDKDAHKTEIYFINPILVQPKE